MSVFRPPLRKRTVENDENFLTDESCCSESHASTQNSQELLSCGFLPPKQRKRTPFRPPLRDLASPGQGYINRILHEEEAREEGTGMTSKFELAPLNDRNQLQKDTNNDDCDALISVSRKHINYLYYVGNRKIEHSLIRTTGDKNSSTTIGSKPAASTFRNDTNESRFKVFEFQPSQDVGEAKAKSETLKNEKSLAQPCISMDIYHAMRKARQEIREIRRRYAAKKTGCVIEEPSNVQENQQPLKLSMKFLTKENVLHSQDIMTQTFFLSSGEEEDALLREE